VCIISEMSTIDSGETNATISTEISSCLEETSKSIIDSPSSYSTSEDNLKNHDVESVESKNVVLNRTTNHIASLSVESASGLTEMQVFKVLKFRLMISFFIIICFVIILYLIPIILYYVATNTPDEDSGSEYDYETCSVSHSTYVIAILC